MKKVLLVTALSAALSGRAEAEITLSGDARFGIITNNTRSSDLVFISRIYLRTNLVRDTDSGLTFGTSVAITDTERVGDITAGAFFVSGPFGRLALGDVEGAATAAVGHVAGVGLISANDQNEVSYIANGGGGFRPGLFGTTSDPSALYRYRKGDLALYASLTQPGNANQTAYAFGANYKIGDYVFALGLEHERTAALDIDQIILGARATFGPVTAKAIYGHVTTSLRGFDASQWAVSAIYTSDALAMTAYYTDDSDLGTGRNNTVAYGIGASVPLGSNAFVVGGYYRNPTFDQNGVELGIVASF